MSYIKTIDQKDATGQLKDIYDNLSDSIGQIPNIIKVQSLRPDLLEPLLGFMGALMVAEHGLSKTTKELIAAYVSKINSCEYWLDAHSAMVMAQGFSQEDVKSILDDIERTTLIDDKTKAILRFSEKVTRHAYKVTEADIQSLKDLGYTDEDVLEATEVIALFNFLDRIADALGAPVENMQQAMSKQG